MPIRLEERARRLAQVVELTELVGHIWPHPHHGVADRMLPVGDDSGHRHRQHRTDLLEQEREVRASAAE
jgi:hypothetical protein